MTPSRHRCRLAGVLLAGALLPLSTGCATAAGPATAAANRAPVPVRFDLPTPTNSGWKRDLNVPEGRH